MADSRHAADEVWLGLDLGTQSARVIAVGGDGELIAAQSRPLTSHRDGPRHEQDPRQWWEALAEAGRAAMESVPPGAVRGAALCATSGTILLVDDDGNPLTRGLMYDDARATRETAEVNEAGARTWQALGYSRMQPSWALPKLLWLLRSSDAGAGARLAHQPDVVTRRLTGTDVPSDSSHALKTGYDVVDEHWPEEVLAALGIGEEVMPPVARAGSRLGSVCAAAAAETGIPAGTPLFAGMTDGCAAQLGAGALTPGSWNSVLGTTLVVKGVTAQLVRDPAGVVYSHRSPDGGWLPGGASSSGAGVLSEHFPGRDLEALNRQAAGREPASVIAYPLVSRGERFPFTAPEAEPFLLGRPADEVDFYAALLQGVAFVERLVFDYLDLLGAATGGDLTLTGGGARSAYWSQLRADVLGRPVRVPAHAEAGLGMAVLACARATERPLAEAATRMVRVQREIEPRPERAERFREPYARFVDELQNRGWLDATVADHTRRRAAQ
ncbi:MAG: carbohydrate kinase, FGGY() [uncultured Solirubrobacteraceae bacterium]|uniref:Carbohydrate kinase, FGGY( ) n=1 Tax=uncultured Solirubrobacteraceae bacterium TaxID=1162706 RepID=A0A6J4RVC5_9ACTN|nr:MAG: carbohydrate kinase, FGGY() [uncultured Solirubrobacteraceae bacterium]